MTDYPAHIVARACELLNEEWRCEVFSLDGDPNHKTVRAVCRALMETATMTDYPAHIVTRKFQLCQRVAKTKGSSWTGKVVGFYSTSLTPIGYAVESENEPGSVQIYPESALRAMETVPEPVDPLVEAMRDVWLNDNEDASDGTWHTDAEALREALAKLGHHIAPIPAPVSEERMMEMAREIYTGGAAIGVNLALTGIKRGLAEREPK